MLARRILYSRPVAALLCWILAHMNHLLPLRRLRETATLLAFHHPRPAYPLHILLVPKRQLASLEAIGEQDADFLADLFGAVQSLAAEFRLHSGGYRLIVNGGANQDFPHLHFHLISDTFQRTP